MQQTDSCRIRRIPAAEQQETISVIVACYNIEKYLGRCVDSVLRQTWQKLELILVDDGSTDATGRLCDEYAQRDARVRVLHRENGGQGAARNQGIAAATGNFIGFVDGDDYIEPQMYEVLMSVLMQSGTDVAICSYLEESVDAAGGFPGAATVAPAQKQEVPGGSLLCCRVNVLDRSELLTCLVEESELCPIRNAVWNKLYRRELFQGLSMAAHRYEDILFTTQIMAAAQSGCFVDTELYHYIIDRKDSTMNKDAFENILRWQIPSYREKDAFLCSIGREDLALEHAYMVYKKLLLLYTQARRSRSPFRRQFMKQAQQVIRQCRPEFDRIYSCRIADPHQKMRMQMFLRSTILYNGFMDLNDGLILPLRQKFRH